MSWTDDPVRDYDRYAARQERQLRRFPRCNCCDQYIQTDSFYEINGEPVCPDYLDENFKRSVDDYIE